jgi:protein O-mannosyl-transferase
VKKPFPLRHVKARTNLSSFSNRPWLPAAAAGVLVLAALAAYAHSLTVPFLFDDAPAIERNLSIRHLWPLGDALAPPQTAAGATGRPLINLTLAVNYALGGLDPRGYHLFNLVIHALTGLTLFGLVRRTLLLPSLQNTCGEAALPFAFGVAGLWLMHPLLTESVLCVVQRNELLVGLFYLLTLYCFVRSVSSPRPGRWRMLAFASCLLGMASKEVMATAPLMVLLYDRTFVAGTIREAGRRRRWFYLALASTWFLLAVLVSQHHQRAGIAGFGLGVSPWQYLLTQCRALTIYLKLSLWPYPLVLDYGVDMAKGPAEVWPQGLLVLALLAATVTALWRRPVLGFLGAWFFVILAPSSSLVPLTTQPIAEHRMYMPLAAIIVLTLAGVWKLAGRWSAPLVVTLALGAGWLTFNRTADYQSEAAIWMDTIAKQPANARAHASLAHVLIRQKRLSEALPRYEEALRLRPDYADVQSDYALALLQAGRAGEAIGHLEIARSLKPGDHDIQFNLAVAFAQAARLPETRSTLEELVRQDPLRAKAWNNLGDARMKSGLRAEALLAFEQALRVSPGFAAAHNNAGLALAGLGHGPEAIGHYAAAVRLEPDNLEIRNNFGNALLQAGQLEGAAAQYQAAVGLNPQLAGLYYNLGNIWLALDRLQDAIKEYEAALGLQVDFAEAQHNLGLALMRSGRPAEAVTHYRAALRLLPDSAEAHHNLAVVLAQLGQIDEAIVQDEAALRYQPDLASARAHLRQLQGGK